MSMFASNIVILNIPITITNRLSTNAVVGMKIMKDGSLQFLKGSPFPTGAKDPGRRRARTQSGLQFERCLDLASGNVFRFTRLGIWPPGYACHQ